MSDPVARAARRQNAIDALAEQLCDWGCPPDLAATRALGLLHQLEAHGWTLPTTDAPPPRGRGSTDTGRAAARTTYANVRAGCTCGVPYLPLPPDYHLTGCPTRRQPATEGTTSGTQATQEPRAAATGHTETPEPPPTPHRPAQPVELL